jgi:hypothetical protein
MVSGLTDAITYSFSLNNHPEITSL